MYGYDSRSQLDITSDYKRTNILPGWYITITQNKKELRYQIKLRGVTMQSYWYAEADYIIRN